MARLYHKAYRRGGGRKGGFKKASPDPNYNITAYTYGGITTQTRPAYLGTFVDEFCGTTYKRITDATALGSANRHRLAYTKTPVEFGDPDNPNIAISSGEPPWILQGPLKSNAFEYIKGGPIDSGWTDSEQYPSVLRNRIYQSALSTGRFRYTNVDTEVRTTVRDFTTDGYPFINAKMGEATPSYDEDIWGIMARTTALDTAGEWHILIYKNSTDEIIQTFDWNVVAAVNNTNGGNCINHVHISPLGNYLVASFQNTTPPSGYVRGYHSFRISDGAYMGRVLDNDNHGDVGLAEDGVTEIAVGQKLNGDLAYGKLDGSLLSQTIIVDYIENSGWSYWTSMRCWKRPGYAYVGTLRLQDGDNPYEDLVVAVRVATGECELWARGYGGGADTERYWCPSADGKRLYVTLGNPLRAISPNVDTGLETYMVTYEPA
jgi:hypothetical protein